MSNFIQRLELANWGTDYCAWEEVKPITHYCFPRISHCASVYVPKTDYVLIWGGDHEAYGGMGYDYIAVNLKLGLGEPKRVLENTSRSEGFMGMDIFNSQSENSRVEFVIGKPATR